VPTQQKRQPDRAFGKADIHIHSLASDGLNSPQQILDYVETETDLDVIAITDHDHVDGALEARALWEKGHYSFDVVVGEEVTTQSGHLIALNISTCVRMFQPLEKTIQDIRAQGGLVIVPHPLAWFSAGLRRWRMETIMAQPPEMHFDGMETFNPSLAGRNTGKEATALATLWSLAQLGGSDSHCLDTIGSARTIFPGRSWADMRQAIAQRTTLSEGEFWELSDYTSIAVPQAFRSLVILPGKRVKTMAGWFLRDHGMNGPE
jgi:predicted metal-dependent phosphoesterase TrpH